MVSLLKIYCLDLLSFPYSTLCTVQYSAVQYSSVQYSTVQFSTVQYSAVQLTKENGSSEINFIYFKKMKLI